MPKVVLPVRFVAAGRVVQCTCGELTETAVFVRCSSPPTAGITIGLKLYLPDRMDALATSGWITRVETAPERSGFWAELVDLDDTAAGRIAAMLVSIAERGLKDARTLPRFELRLKASLHTPEKLLTEYTRNISAGGMFIETAQPPDLGAILPVDIELGDGKPAISVEAQVVHVDRNPPGVGVQFIGATDEFRERFDALLRDLPWDKVPRPR